jgi:hypothetical protein
MKENSKTKIPSLLFLFLLLIFFAPFLLSKNQNRTPLVSQEDAQHTNPLVSQRTTPKSPQDADSKPTEPTSSETTLQSPPKIQHTPISTFEYGTLLSIVAQMPSEVASVLFLFRHDGIPDFQARIMEKTEENTYFLDFDTSILPGLEFEYYLIVHIQGKDIYFPSDAPTNTYKVTGQTQEPIPDIPSDFPLPEEEAKKFRLPVEVTGSVQAYLKKDSSQSQQNNSTANVRIFKTHNAGDYAINFDSNFNYASQPIEGENNVDLSNMILSVNRGNHTLRAGDISVNESEYTVYGLGRRGVDYAFNNQKTSVHLFNMNTQEPKGFSGFGIPRQSISILGGTVGQNFFNNAYSAKLIYVTGKDDPQKGVNVGFSDFYNSREGNVISLLQEARLLQNRMLINAEIAHSNYDENLADELGKTPDNALKIGGSYAHGKLFIGVNYNYIGKDFNSIGYQYFTNNRKGLQTNISLNLGKVTISGGYNNAKDNVENIPSEYTTQSQDGNLNVMWNISDKYSLNVGYRRNNQDTSLDEGENIFNQDSLSDEFSSSFSMYFSETLNLNLSATFSDLDSQNFPQNSSSNLTMNLGGTWRFKQILIVSPNFGYNEAKNKFSDEKTQSFNTFLTSEIYVWPQVISFTLTGSYMNNKIPGGDSENLALSGNINIHLNRFLNFGNFILSIRGDYSKATMPGYSDSTFTSLLQLDFQF